MLPYDLLHPIIPPLLQKKNRQNAAPVQSLDKTVDFERLLGAKEGAKEEEKAEAKEGEKAEAVRTMFEGKQGNVEELSEKTSANRAGDGEAFESKRARLDRGDSENEFVYTLNEQRKENWIRKGLEVKILNEKLANGK